MHESNSNILEEFMSKKAIIHKFYLVIFYNILPMKKKLNFLCDYFILVENNIFKILIEFHSF